VSGRRSLLLLALLVAGLAAAGSASGDNPIDQKKAEAVQVYNQIIGLDQQLSDADEKINLANYRLTQVVAEQKLNRRELRIARANLGKSRKMIEKRLLAVYNQSTPTTLDLVLGSTNIGDLLNRLDAASRLTALDNQVVGQVATFKASVQEHARALRNDHVYAARLLAQRQAVRDQVSNEIDQRNQLLTSIKGQIQTLEAQQAARELEAVREAQAQAEAAQAAQAAEAQATVVGASAAAPADTSASSSSSSSSDGSNSPTVTVDPSSPFGSQVVSIAMSYIGTPYVWGGASPGGFDCSGLVMYSFAQLGVQLPHSSYAQFNYGIPVSYDQLQPGDLVFFDGLGHVGIYIGGGEYVDAPYTGAYVRVDSLTSGWALANYSGARRIT
jgi:peptidoglycan DL-endopeptidase CwlO